MGVTDVAIPALICDLVIRSFPGAVEAHEVVNEIKVAIAPSSSPPPSLLSSNSVGSPKHVEQISDQCAQQSQAHQMVNLKIITLSSESLTQL